MADQKQRLEFEIGANYDGARKATSDFEAALTNNFASISRVSDGALRGLNNQVAILARQVPVVGYPLAGITQELFKMGRASAEVDKLSGAFRSFQVSLANIAGGKNEIGASLLKNMGIDVQKALRDAGPAFEQFKTALRSVESDAGRAAASINVVGASATADLIPALEGAAGAGSSATIAIGGTAAAVLALVATEGLLLAAILKSTKAAGDLGSSIYDAGIKTGLSAEFLSVAKVAAGELDANFDRLVLGLARYESNLSKAVTNPTGEASKALQVLGLRAEQLKNALPDERVRLFGEALARVRDVSERNRILIDLGNRGFVDQAGVLVYLTRHYGELEEKTKALGVYFTGEGAASAKRFNVALNDLDLAFKGMEIRVGSQLLPVLNSLVTTFTSLLVNAGPLVNFFGRLLAGAVAESVGEIKGLIALVQTLPTALKNPLGASAEFLKNLAALNKTVDTPLPDLGGDDDTGFAGKTKKGETADQKLSRRLAAMEEDRRALNEQFKAQEEDEKDSYERRLKSLKDYTDRTNAIEQARLASQIFALTAEKIAVDNSAVAPDKKLAELKKLDREIERERAESHKRIQTLDRDEEKKEEQLQKEHDEAQLKILDDYGRKEIEKIQQQADRHLITREQAEARIFGFEQASRERRREFLEGELKKEEARPEEQTKIKDQIDQINSEEAAAQVQFYGKLQKGREEDVDYRRKYNETILKLARDAAQMELSTQEFILHARIAIHGDTIKLERELYEVRRKLIDAEHERRLKDLNDEEDELLRFENNLKRRLEIEARYHDLRVAEQHRYKGESGRNDEEEQHATDTATRIKDAFGRPLDFKETGINELVGGIKDLTGALQQGVEAWALYGESIGVAMKKALAGVLAKVAGEALIQSLLHAAYAIGALAFGDFHGAAKHALAAAEFAAVAAAAGFGGRAIAKSAGLGSTAAGAGALGVSGGAGGSATPANNAQFNYNGAAQPSSAVAQPGSNNIFREIRDTLNRIQGIPADHVLAMGAERRPAIISDTYNRQLSDNHDVRERANYLLNAGRV